MQSLAAGGLMFHLVASTIDGDLVASNQLEVAALWRCASQALPGLVALYLMPNHLHALVPDDRRLALAAALSGYARWRAHRLCLASARLWARLPSAERVEDRRKAGLVERYIHLNGCRAGLERDPLAAVWSTHRDAVGLTVRPVRAPAGIGNEHGAANRLRASAPSTSNNHQPAPSPARPNATTPAAPRRAPGRAGRRTGVQSRLRGSHYRAGRPSGA